MTVKRFEVKVVPNAKRNEVLQQGDMLRVYLTAPPLSGRANRALIEVLAEELGAKRRNVRIVSGEKSRRKVVEIDFEG